MESWTGATLASLLQLPVVAFTSEREAICVIDRQRWARSTRRFNARRRNWSYQGGDRGGTHQPVQMGLRCESLHQWYFLLVVSKLDSWVHSDVQLSFHSRFRSTYVYDLLTGRFRRRFSQSALLPRIKLVHCAVVMYIHLFYTFVHTCFHHSFTPFAFIYNTECVRASSSHIICSALCVCCCSLSLCCAPDTINDEGKRRKRMLLEKHWHIYRVHCMSVWWRHKVTGV